MVNNHIWGICLFVFALLWWQIFLLYKEWKHTEQFCHLSRNILNSRGDKVFKYLGKISKKLYIHIQSILGVVFFFLSRQSFSILFLKIWIRNGLFDYTYFHTSVADLGIPCEENLGLDLCCTYWTPQIYPASADFYLGVYWIKFTVSLFTTFYPNTFLVRSDIKWLSLDVLRRWC